MWLGTGGKQLKSSLSYFDRESVLEITTADGIEEFVFSVYQLEKHRSGIDFLSFESLDEFSSKDNNGPST